MESRASVAGTVCDPAAAAVAAAAKHIKEEDEAGVEPRPRALFRGLRGTRRERGERRETAAPPLAVVTDHPPREIKREAPWGDGELHVEVRVGQAQGRCGAAGEARATSDNKNKNKKLLADRTALVDGRAAGEVQLQTGGRAALTDDVGTGKVGRRAAVVDGAGAGGFPLVEAKLEELRANAVVVVTRDAGLQADGKSLTKKPAKKARLTTMTIAEVEAKRAEDMAARSREEACRKARIAAYREQEKRASRTRSRKSASPEKMSPAALRARAAACRKVLRKAAAEDRAEIWKEYMAAHRVARRNAARDIRKERERLHRAAARAQEDEAAREKERLRGAAKRAVAARARARDAARERDLDRRAAADEAARERARLRAVITRAQAGEAAWARERLKRVARRVNERTTAQIASAIYSRLGGGPAEGCRPKG